jgi:hypothetical protein
MSHRADQGPVTDRSDPLRLIDRELTVIYLTWPDQQHRRRHILRRVRRISDQFPSARPADQSSSAA